MNAPPAAALRSPAVAEALFLASIVVVPLLAGTAIAYAGRPWWWAAVVAVVVLLVFAIAPALLALAVVVAARRNGAHAQRHDPPQPAETSQRM